MTPLPPQKSDDADPWRPFRKGLSAFVVRRVPYQDAEDVVQDVLLRLHRSAATLRDTRRTEAWVYGVARRTIADYYRRRPPTEALPDEAEIRESEEPRPAVFASFPGNHSVHEEVLSWLRPMAEALPDRYRQALIMADFEGRPQKEVAKALGLSLSGAKSRVQRARALLGENLRRCCKISLGPEGTAVDFERQKCDC